MRLLCMSDLHGHLPVCDPKVFAADVAVIAGDIMPADREHHGGHVIGLMNQEQWFIHTFLPWAQSLPVKHVVMTWGNHDHLGEHPDRYRSVLPENVHVLVNESCEIDGVTFYGVPQTPRFFDWAFNEDDTPESLGRRWAEVPDQTHILISHGPPFGTVDWVNDRTGQRVGSHTQADWLKSEASNRPVMVLCGHIHGSGGQFGMCGDVKVANVGILSERYQVVRNPMLLDVDGV
jgi:Icc-related predicted phosphoesterase